MASDPKAAASAGVTSPREKGLKIYTYPKIIFIFPTFVASLVCWFGMLLTPPDEVASYNFQRYEAQREDREARRKGADTKPVPAVAGSGATSTKVPVSPFRRRENVLGLIFFVILLANLIILALDFPRFALLGIVLGVLAIAFFLLWLGIYVSILEPLFRVFERVYVVANAEFYFLFSLVLAVMYGLIWATRRLDYWEILPNEILHHHGPLSDLERYPTMNLKFDKEIPDVFEYLLLGAGRLILHVTGESKAIVLDNVLWVSTNEESLKKLMSRMEVRVTTDQEVASP